MALLRAHVSVSPRIQGRIGYYRPVGLDLPSSARVVLQQVPVPSASSGRCTVICNFSVSYDSFYRSAILRKFLEEQQVPRVGLAKVSR